MNFLGLFSQLQGKLLGKLPNIRNSPAAQGAKPFIPDLRLMVFIVDWTNVNLILSVFEEEKAACHFMSKGKGTATSDALDLLGIGAIDKAVISCLEQTEKIPVLLREARKKLGSKSQGVGIAFTVPLSAINSPILRIYKQDDGNKADDGMARSVDFPNALIISSINMGCSDEFMNTARKAGASGGTVLNARSFAHDGAVKFFGISVQEKREIIFILTSQEKKDPIMQALSEAHGLGSNSQGIMFSLPVEKTMSLSFQQELST